MPPMNKYDITKLKLHTCVCNCKKMSLTVHVYCNGIEQGYIEVVHGETNESLSLKIKNELGISDFTLIYGLDPSALCQDDRIYIEYDKLIEAKRFIQQSLDNNRLEDLNINESYIQALIDAGMINTKDNLAVNALHYASDKGNNNIVQMLITASININIIDTDGRTALYKASNSGHHYTVQMLITAGADVNISDRFGGTALFASSEMGHNDILQTLINAGADVHINSWGRTPLHWAALCNHYDVVKTLINADIDVNRQDIIGTALHWAAMKGNNDIVKLLIAAGIDTSITNTEGETALYKAMMGGYSDVVKTLSSNIEM